MTLAQHPEPLEFEDFSIQFAETNEERLEACRVRYPVFVEELHRVRYVDHGARVYSDRLDELGAHILLVRAGSKSAGTLRFTLRSETGFLDEDERLFQKVLTAVGSDNIALADRGAILPEFRGAKLYPHMWAYGFKYLRSRGIISVVGVVDASNEKLIDFHRRQGWTVLSASVIDEGKEWHLISISLTENEEPDKESPS
jgi:ribosomal protein S18 acetylase RimI-like enzyme